MFLPFHLGTMGSIYRIFSLTFSLLCSFFYFLQLCYIDLCPSSKCRSLWYTRLCIYMHSSVSTSFYGSILIEGDYTTEYYLIFIHPFYLISWHIFIPHSIRFTQVSAPRLSQHLCFFFINLSGGELWSVWCSSRPRLLYMHSAHYVFSHFCTSTVQSPQFLPLCWSYFLVVLVWVSFHFLPFFHFGLFYSLFSFSFTYFLFVFINFFSLAVSPLTILVMCFPFVIH